MHGSSDGGGRKRARIEIIPLIDIIFFLLATFVMVSLSMTKNQGVNVMLPTAGTAASLGDQQELEKAVTLSVNDKGDVFYNKEKITLAQLPMRLQTLKSMSKDPKIIINSDGGADFKFVVGVLDEVRRIGIAKVGINTGKEMKLGWVIGLAAATFMHVVVLYFGGIFFMDKKKDAHSLQTVDLLSNLDAEEEKDKKKPDEPQEEKTEEIASDDEPPPDAAEILRNLDAPAMNDAPALEAASLSAIEAALNGGGGGGDFAEALSFGSGGRIGGTGEAGIADQKVEEAFSLAEIDQKPQVVYQESPAYPSEMRGKKVEGVVTLIFVVDAAGKVVNPKAEKSSHTAFELPALAAIKKWKFEPGVRAGERVASKMRVSIRFPAG